MSVTGPPVRTADEAAAVVPRTPRAGVPPRQASAGERSEPDAGARPARWQPLGPWLLTIPQVCEVLGVSRATVDRLAKSGHLPGRVQLGGVVRYDAATLRRWLDELAAA